MKQEPPVQSQVPLCVDLDGTLIRTDMLVETLLEFVRARPIDLLRVPIWLLRGRAYLKHRLAVCSKFDPALLPYEDRLLAHLRAQRELGRKLVLVSASNESIVQRVAAHVGLFDEVIGSDGNLNIKG